MDFRFQFAGVADSSGKVSHLQSGDAGYPWWVVSQRLQTPCMCVTIYIYRGNDLKFIIISLICH